MIPLSYYQVMMTLVYFFKDNIHISPFISCVMRNGKHNFLIVKVVNCMVKIRESISHSSLDIPQG